MNEISEKLFNRFTNKEHIEYSVDKAQTNAFIEKALRLFYPNAFTSYNQAYYQYQIFLKNMQNELGLILNTVLPACEADKLSYEFFYSLENIANKLDLDANAIKESDPAASSLSEIITCYPGFFTIAVYRIAHFFYQNSVPLIPRLFSEYAHEKTGIDIHPGAKIGQHFSIDHGTGIVIGETCTIGNHVKLYQGVTLGSLAPEQNVKEDVRHPTIEDGCIIYSNATILGGKTVIGKNSIIGGNCWIIKSIPDETRVFHTNTIQKRSINHESK
ncbi:MAG: serine acetyltransferase [Fusobacteria bacterium]|nr:serine acetyltransferase [Fusobacteriota bacterium]